MSNSTKIGATGPIEEEIVALENCDESVEAASALRSSRNDPTIIVTMACRHVREERRHGRPPR